MAFSSYVISKKTTITKKQNTWSLQTVFNNHKPASFLRKIVDKSQIGVSVAFHEERGIFEVQKVQTEHF